MRSLANEFTHCKQTKNDIQLLISAYTVSSNIGAS